MNMQENWGETVTGPEMRKHRSMLSGVFRQVQDIGLRNHLLQDLLVVLQEAGVTLLQLREGTQGTSLIASSGS